jgi:hypothetical protein
MRRRPVTDQLREVVAVRELQRLRAQAETMKAASAVQASQVVLQACERERDTVAERWHDSLSASTVLPEMTVLWSRALRSLNDEAQRAAADERQATADLAQSSVNFGAATARRDAAESLARQAHKQDARKHEEGALQDALDRHALQKRRK